jgi:fructokinase
MNRIGIDLGGTKIEGILTTDDPMNVLVRIRVSTEQEKGYQQVLSNIAGLIEELRNACDGPVKLGMGIPGVINQETKRVQQANTQCLIGETLEEDLAKRLGQGINIENDANCFVLSEALHGAGKGHQCVAGIIMGTGMGGGIVINGQLWKGRTGLAGEWGHASIEEPNGVLCWCGRKGCAETYLSGTGIQRIYRDETGEDRSVASIDEGFLNGENSCQVVMDKVLNYFARSMANIIVHLEPNIIVIGGGVSNILTLYTDGLERTKAIVFGTPLTKIVENQLGDSSGVHGAASLAV